MKYWPSGVNDPSVFGAYQIELSEDEKDRGQYITRRFKVSPVDKVKGLQVTHDYCPLPCMVLFFYSHRKVV